MKKVNVVIVYGGELAKDVAEQIEALKPTDDDFDIDVTLRCASERPKTLLDYKTNKIAAISQDEDEDEEADDDDNNKKKENDEEEEIPDTTTTSTIVCFVLQTIENNSPTESGGTTLRFFKRKTHSNNLLSCNGTAMKYCVFGLGDSNLLFDRQTTGSKDCNYVAQELDTRLESLGGVRQCTLGLADERTGLTEVEPWIHDIFWKSIIN
jgi:hypothetical protein